MSKRDRVLRLAEADRSQVRVVVMDPDRLVPEDDSVRAVWSFVKSLDLSAFLVQVKSVRGKAGRPPIDPRILMALWLQGTLDGIGSAREIARLCEMHARYQWICGGVTPGYHRLSDFRSNSEQELDELLTDSVAVLMHKGLVDLERVAQDGMKVRASAGTGSFRSDERLAELHEIAQEQVRCLKKEAEGDPAAGSRRRQAARLRAAEDQALRIKQALAELPEIQERKKSNNGKKKSKARCSTTDPDARVMKMPDGGFRPALNVHLISDTKTKLIAAVEVNNQGTDFRMAVPLAEQLHKRHGKNPSQWLEDGGCVTLDGIDKLAERGIEVFAPVREPRSSKKKATEVRATDSVAVAAWRMRMDTELGKGIYKQRGATAELVNAHARAHGLNQFFVRGVQKARSVVLLLAITHNMRRSWALI